MTSDLRMIPPGYLTHHKVTKGTLNSKQQLPSKEVTLVT
nr:MAG TPA: hypothetical protein [Caudoviricetes sp.]